MLVSLNLIHFGMLTHLHLCNRNSHHLSDCTPPGALTIMALDPELKNIIYNQFLVNVDTGTEFSRAIINGVIQ